MCNPNKKKYRVTAFSWEFGEKVVHEQSYVYAFTTKQAYVLAAMSWKRPIRDSWSTYVEEC